MAETTGEHCANPKCRHVAGAHDYPFGKCRAMPCSCRALIPQSAVVEPEITDADLIELLTAQLPGQSPATWDLRELADDLVANWVTAMRDLQALCRERNLDPQLIADRTGYPVEDVERDLLRYDSDPTLSMLRRFALAVGARIELQVVPVTVEAGPDNERRGQ